MDEAQIRAEAEAKVRAEYEDEFRREQENRRFNDALNAARVAASSEPSNERQVGAAAARLTQRDGNARIYGAVLAAQMLAGLPGEGLADDGYGDATGVHPDAA